MGYECSRLSLSLLQEMIKDKKINLRDGMIWNVQESDPKSLGKLKKPQREGI